MAVGYLAVAAGTVTMGLLGALGPGGCKSQTVSGGALRSGAGIPPALVPIFQAAATRYRLGALGPGVLAAIARTESDFGRSRLPGVRAGVNSYGCCAGPMQFYVLGKGGGTWGAYGVDANRDGRKDVYDIEDAIHGAAHYLRASGAPRDWRKAIFAYNHADWYVRRVLDQARRYTTGSLAVLTETAVLPDGGGGRLIWPLRGVITGRFGEWRGDHAHAGLDIAAPHGTPIHAALEGTVVHRSYTGGYGNLTCLRHTSRFSSCYAHQSAYTVRLGQRVAHGQVIGRVGNTGHSFGAHLHFETRLGKGLAGRAVDPKPYLNGAQIIQPSDPAHVAVGCGAATSGETVAEPSRRLRAIIDTANYLHSLNLPYRYGGGHLTPVPMPPPRSGLDCSSTVSFVLQRAGYRLPTMTSSQFEHWGEPGPGIVTIYANATHVWMEINGRAFGTSGFARPRGRPGWFTREPRRGYRSSFAVRHPPNLGLDNSGG